MVVGVVHSVCKVDPSRLDSGALHALGTYILSNEIDVRAASSPLVDKATKPKEELILVGGKGW
jgi:hypothetical protein